MTCSERDTATPLTSVPLYVLRGAKTFPNRPECVVGVTCAELFCGCSRVGGWEREVWFVWACHAAGLGRIRWVAKLSRTVEDRKIPSRHTTDGAVRINEEGGIACWQDVHCGK